MENNIIKDIPKNIDPYTYYYKKITIAKAYHKYKEKQNNFNNITGFYILPIDINQEISKINKHPFGHKQIVPLLTTLDLDIGQEILDEIK